jgi:acyl-CoA synthetase (AMP-forming)/AMP-acid ligase II
VKVSIREDLNGRLANLKVPVHLLVVEEIPRSVTGKVGRSTLAKAFAERLQSGFIAPKKSSRR